MTKTDPMAASELPATPLRVTFLHVAGYGRAGGGFRVLTAHARALAERGHAVTLVSPAHPSRPLPGPIGRRLPFRRRLPIQSAYLDGAPYENVVLDGRPEVTSADVPDADVIVASYWRAVLWMAAMPPQKGRKVHLVQDYEPTLCESRSQFDAAIDSPTAKLCVSTWIADQIAARPAAARPRVVPNGVDTDLFRPGVARAGPPHRFGLAYSSAPNKRAGLAVDALRLCEGVEGTAFGVASVPPQHADAFARVQVAPSQADIVACYARCRGWLFPSAKEGFGLPILEALACGTPVVATRAGAAPDLIEDGVNGYLVEPTPEAMAAAIRRLNAMPEASWRAMSAAARATAERHRLADASAAFVSAIRDVVEGRLPATRAA